MGIPRNLSNLAPGASTAGVLGVTKGGTGVTTSTGTGSVVLNTSPSFPANLNFTGTGNRITGDMTSSPVGGAPFAFQTSTVNSLTQLYVLPNGTSKDSYLFLGSGTSANENFVQLGLNNSGLVAGINVGIIGSGTYLPFTISTSNTERLRITTNGGFSFGASGTAFGSSGQILMSNGNAVPTWVSSGDTTANVGYLNIPQNSQSANYTLVAADAGKHIFHPSADTSARTFTIPANSSVPFAIGTAVTFINQNGAGVITIAITSDTMRLAGAGTTGSRTLAANGVATAIKITSTEWIISGTGLT